MFDAKTLDAWLTHIEVLHSKPIDLGLDRMKTMVERMGLDFSSRTVITVGGTNGKGSTCAMLESIYRAAGYTTGMHTSPHLIRLNERCVVNGREVDDERLMDAFRAVEKARGDMTLSYFEYTALAILRIFREDELDVVILEIGLGGRLDAINTIDSNAAVISTIGIDHVAFLGNTREAIGLEKAHIYRPGCPAVCADADVPATVRNHVEQIGAKRLFAGEDWTVTVKENGTFTFAQGATLFEDLPEPALAGVNQYRNAGGVLSVIASLMDRVPVTLDDIRTGLRQVRLTARFELITTDPVPTVIDVGHNPQAAEVLLTNVVRSRRPGEHTIAVCGMLADKDRKTQHHLRGHTPCSFPIRSKKRSRPNRPPKRPASSLSSEAKAESPPPGMSARIRRPSTSWARKSRSSSPNALPSPFRSPFRLPFTLPRRPQHLRTLLHPLPSLRRAAPCSSSRRLRSLRPRSSRASRPARRMPRPRPVS